MNFSEHLKFQSIFNKNEKYELMRKTLVCILSNITCITEHMKTANTTIRINL